jgi:phage anti-repressor protein
MITTNLTGNFGNHMWYYTICRLVAEKLGFEWGINPIATHDYYNGQSQFYFMNIDFGKNVEVSGKNERGLNTYKGINNEYYDFPREFRGCLINKYDSKVFEIKDNTMVHLISQSEDYLIERKNDIINWFQIKSDYSNLYEKKIKQLGLVIDDNLCVINFRGGEYRSIPNLIARKEYWTDSINYMKSLNSNMRFIIITDDEPCAKHFIGDFPCFHIDIGFDFYVINNSKYTILSNSSFGWWASWLNTNSKFIIAPKYWSQHNVSDGYWGLGDQYVRKFNYMNREGFIENYDKCKLEAENYYHSNGLL